MNHASSTYAGSSIKTNKKLSSSSSLPDTKTSHDLACKMMQHRKIRLVAAPIGPAVVVNTEGIMMRIANLAVYCIEEWMEQQ